MRHLNSSEAERQATLSTVTTISTWAAQRPAFAAQYSPRAHHSTQLVPQDRYPYNPTLAPGRVPHKRSVEPDRAVLSRRNPHDYYPDLSRGEAYRGYPSEPQAQNSSVRAAWERERGYEGERGGEVWSSRGRAVQSMDHEHQMVSRRSASYDMDDYDLHSQAKIRPSAHQISPRQRSPAAASYSSQRDLTQRTPSIKQEWPEDLTQTLQVIAEAPATPMDSVPPTPDCLGGSEGEGGLRLVPLDKCTPTTAKPSPTAGDIELCLICGDRASGFHYNALSCEGCKGFFRRSITKGSSYACKYGGKCEMDMWMRRRCQACRLRRCKDVGMREECLLSERQCSARNARRHYRKQSAEKAAAAAALPSVAPASPAPAAFSKPLQPAQIIPTDRETRSMDQVSGLGVVLNPERAVDEECLLPCGRGPMENVLAKLCDEHKAVIRCLVAYQDKYELPSEEDLAKLSEVKTNEQDEPEDTSDALFMHMVQMTLLVTRLVVSFAKSLPGFLSLDKLDQIILLKGSASEVMMLRTARRYDPQTDTVVFGNGQPFTAHAMEFGGLQGHIDSMFEFSRGMSKLMLDDVEYAMLTALSIFSVRAGLKDLSAVEQIQDIYLEVLLAYLAQRRAGNRFFVPRLLMKLVELRSLSAEHAQVLRNLTLERKNYPPLLREYFDIAE